MRMIGFMAVGLLALTACGGGEKKGAGSENHDATSSNTAGHDSSDAATSAGAGATHTIDMVLDGAAYKYVPETVTIKSGDKVVFNSKSGFPHNIEFYADSMPAEAISKMVGALKPLADGTAKTDSLSGPMMMADQSYEVLFADVPVGEYKFVCQPHTQYGMKGSIVVK